VPHAEARTLTDVSQTERMTGPKKFVVGTDGSDNALAAMRWASEEAAIHRADLEAVLVWNFLNQHHADRSDTFDNRYTEASAREALAAWVTEAFGPDATVAQRLVFDAPARGLLEAGDAADLLILGARGTGGFEGLLLGSVSERVAQQATGPVAVVRTVAPVGNGRVVVGVDGSARSLAALRWAAAEAHARDALLDVVHAWRLPVTSASAMMAVMPDLSVIEEGGRAVLDQALADPSLKGIRVRPHLNDRTAARELVELAAGAGLVVVAARGLGRVAGALMGSVSRQLLHHAPCPVVVI
jgi:nucleotide-binding universal stress UspA family protein